MRKVKPMPVLEIRKLSDGSVMEVLSRPDSEGKISFMHVSATRSQVFRAVPNEWLDHYRLSYLEA